MPGYQPTIPNRVARAKTLCLCSGLVVTIVGALRAVPRRCVKGRSLGTCWNGCVRTHPSAGRSYFSTFISSTPHVGLLFYSPVGVLPGPCVVPSVLSYYLGPAISETTSKSA